MFRHEELQRHSPAGLPTMRSVIVGTAGHIDHGKSALVQALTGTDPDRLEEEKRRGITIDLGFAHLTLDGPHGPVQLGFVDVPGHERFVRNMLAGAGGIDLVLLVISAQESIKPQTREHFDICRLLQTQRGITVLTKCDLVDKEMLDVVRLEVEEFLRGSFLDLSRAPMVAVSARTGQGLDVLRRELAKAASEAVQRDAQAPFRLPIDRVFTMKGFGTVVTGTMISGQVGKGNEVEILPSAKRARVRGLQVHGAEVEQAVAGQRAALNLAGIPHEELTRGMLLTAAGLLQPTRRLDVRLSLLDRSPALKINSPVHLHLFTTETTASVVLYEKQTMKPGEAAWAQLRTAFPVACAPGDRFIIRQFSPMTTIGGGFVADARPLVRMKAAERIALLSELSAADDSRRIRALVARRGRRGLRLTDAIHETGWSGQRLQQALQPEGQARRIRGCGELLVSEAVFNQLAAELVELTENFQAANPLAGGISKQELVEKSTVKRELFDAVLNAMVAEKKLAITADHVHLPGRGVVMKDEEAESKRQIEEAFLRAGMHAPALREVLGTLNISHDRAQKIVTLLLREKVLVKVGEDLLFHRTALDELKHRLIESKAQSAKIDVTQFKERFGLSRKFAIPLLEYLDREHVTRRVGDGRIIL
jgi:selenocysteine-specific elongation factor